MNIANLLLRSASDHSAKVALRLGDEEVTYGGFTDTAARCAGFLRTSGLEAGERVGFYLPNCLDYLPALCGVWQAGGVGVPLNYLFPDRALRHAVDDSGARWVLALPGDAQRLAGVLEGLPVADSVITLDRAFAEIIESATPFTDVVPRMDGEDALLMYTSGSTGVPKGVRQTHRNVAAESEAVIDWYHLGPDDRALSPMPLFHVGGLQLVSLPMLLRGGETTFMAKWDPLVWLDLAQGLRPTYGGGVSTMIVDLGNRTAGNPVVIDSLRVMMFGGSRTPTAVIERLAAGIGVEGTEIYGQTEQNGLSISYRPGEQRRTGSMGRPLEQIVECRLVPPTGGPDVPLGSDEVGELWVRGDAVTPGYWNRPDANAEKWSDGWFRTGDLVSRDADGYFYYTDRIDDMIVSGGENIFPQMVEEHLANCPDLAEVAVIGTPHERWVEQVTAVVVPNRPGVDAEQVLAWCAEQKELRGMVRPRRVEVVAELPRTGSGKLNRPELKRMFEGD